MKNIRARLKKQVEVASSLDVDFNSDWLTASRIVEIEQRKMLERIKSEMHELIAVMTLEDIEFKILP